MLHNTGIFPRTNCGPIPSAVDPISPDPAASRVTNVESRRLYVTQTRLVLLSEHVSLLF